MRTKKPRGHKQSNRNATNPTPTSLFVTGYVGAVASSMIVAGGLTSFIQKSSLFSPVAKAFMVRFVPFPAVATANVCNVVLMRMNELKQGIKVKALDGTDLGNSKVAAQKALRETALTRIVLPAPILLLPPIIMSWAEQASFLQRFPRLRLPVQATVCTAAFGFVCSVAKLCIYVLMSVQALPLAISLFPQFGELDVSELEPHFHGMKDSHGRVIDRVVYNKGL